MEHNALRLAADPAPKPAKVREKHVLEQIRALLKRLRIVHWKAWGGFIGERGVPDIIGTIPPSGRMLLVEVKGPGGKPSPEQLAFLERHEAAGAIALVAYGPMEVARALADAGFEPARRVLSMFPEPTGG